MENTSKQFSSPSNDRLDWMLEQDLSVEEIYKLCHEDPILFMRAFLTNYFPTPIPWFHRAWIAILLRKVEFLDFYDENDKIIQHFQWKRNWNDKYEQPKPLFWRDSSGRLCLRVTKYTELIVPRGFSKTSIAGIGVPLYRAAYQETKFTVYVSESGPHASMQLNNVKVEIQTNEKFRAIFGVLNPELRDAEKWTSDLIETNTGVVFAARGRGSQIRGLNHRGNRPDQIILDDVEDEESVATDLQRQKVRKWFHGAVKPAVESVKDADDRAIVAIGTKLHNDALLMTLASDPQWTTIMMDALLEDGTALWPERMSLSKIEAEKRSYALAGELDTFYQEYLPTKPAPEETAVFKKRHFKYDIRPDLDSLRIGVAIDPAISEKRRADDAVIKAVGIHQSDGKIYTLADWYKLGPSPQELVAALFDIVIDLGGRKRAIRVGVEAIAYQAALVHIIQEYMFRYNCYFEVETIHHKANKHSRIKGVLAPRFGGGYMVFTYRDPKLEAQLLDFPHSKDDHPDALAMAVAMLDPFAALATPEHVNTAEDIYPPLDEVIGGEWRMPI